MQTIFESILESYEKEISNITAECEATRVRLLDELAAAEARRDALVLEVQEKRSAAILKEKLKEYPAGLVKEHVACSVCGAEMRPFVFMEGEKKQKAWACQAGGLSSDHDLVRV